MEKAKKNVPTLRNALKREFKKDQVAQFALILLAGTNKAPIKIAIVMSANKIRANWAT